MVELHFFWHAFFKIKSKSKTILIDPVLSFKAPSKDFDCMLDCTVKEDDLKNITMILITHEHFDHFDKELVERIAKENKACVVAHQNILQELEKSIPKAFLHPITIGEKISLRGVEIEVIPAHHPQSFYPVGYIINIDGKSIYHAGDTALIDSMAKLKADVALLPIGGYETMDCVDALRVVKIMKPGIAIPMHYNTFKMIQQDPKEFKQKIEKSISKTRVVILNPGKKIRF